MNTSRELADLRARLGEAEDTLRAIRTGDVDAVVVAGARGPRVFTLDGAERAYRLLMESMNEGALTLGADATILYANACFAAMVRCPLEQVIGGSFFRFSGAGDRRPLRALLKQAGAAGSKLRAMLRRTDGELVPTQIATRRLAKRGHDGAVIGIVVTDMTEARRHEEMLRSLSRRVVGAQEAERGRVAVELHDHVTQPLCALLIRCQALANRLSGRDGPLELEAAALRDLLGETAAEAERMSRDLRPGVLGELGLCAVVRSAGAALAKRARVSVTVDCGRSAARMPPDVELALYRIVQEAFANVERHAHADGVHVRLRKRRGWVHLAIGDDGVGFDPEAHVTAGAGQGGLGLLGMRERAAYVGGTLEIKSSRRSGTNISVRIPVPPRAVKALRRGQARETSTRG